MEYCWNKQKLMNLLKKDEEEIKSNDTLLLQAEINSLRCALNMPVLKKIVIKNTNVISAVTYKSANHIFKIRPKYTISPKENKDMTTSEIVSTAYGVLNRAEKKLLSSMIKNEKFNISTSTDIPYTYYLPYHHDAIINTTNRGILSDARNITHEVAHAIYSKNLNYEELKNTRLSYLRETLSIINEMSFIDKLDRYDDVINEHTIFLNNYYEAYLKGVRNSTDVYAQSFALAEYLFMLGKDDKHKYNEYIDMFKENLKNKSDSEIIDSMNIDSADMIRANEKYLNLYKK